MSRLEAPDDFSFPTPRKFHPDVVCTNQERVFHLPFPAAAVAASSSPPVWLLASPDQYSYSACATPIRRSFSAADGAASPWRARVVLRRGARSPALSDYAGGVGEEYDEEGEEEERMDSLWEDLNDDDEKIGKDLFVGSLDVSRRRSVGGPELVATTRRTAATEAERTAVLGATGSGRRRRPGLVVMMRALKKLFVLHKSKLPKEEQRGRLV